MSDKSDASLGLEVEKHLSKLGINTPTVMIDTTPEEKIERIEHLHREIMETMGLDLTDDSLQDTPRRVAKMFVNEVFRGLNHENFPKATVVENKMGYDQMVLEKNVTIMSKCEHHEMPIVGHAHIAYFPKDKVIGLSKLNRIADYFSRRPQIQERLTQQIGETLKFLLGTDDVAVVIEADHYCVKARGIRDTASSTVTSFVSGSFREDPAVRMEYFANINK